MKPYTKSIPCRPCKRKGFILTGEGNPVDCPYCSGTKRRTITAVHPSHKMSRKRCEILAPCGTPRFYSVRHCTKCGRREEEHAAGHFFNGLQYPCTGKKVEDDE